MVQDPLHGVKCVRPQLVLDHLPSCLHCISLCLYLIMAVCLREPCRNILVSERTFCCIALPSFLALLPAVLSSAQTHIIPFCRLSTCSLKVLFMSLHRTKNEIDSKQAVLEVVRFYRLKMFQPALCAAAHFCLTSLWLSGH